MALGEFTKRCEHQVGAKQARSGGGTLQLRVVVFDVFSKKFLENRHHWGPQLCNHLCVMSIPFSSDLKLY